MDTTLKTLALRAVEKGLELMCEISPGVPEAMTALAMTHERKRSLADAI